MPPVQSILCIPGNWPDVKSLNQSLLDSSNQRYSISNDTLIDKQTGNQSTIELCDHDDRMQKAFLYAGLSLDKIAYHTHVVYIVGEGGTIANATRIAQAGSAILQAGGIAIKVESAGKASTKEKWMQSMENFEEHRLYDLFVIDALQGDQGEIASCGMHNLGLKDTMVTGERPEDAIQLIRSFSFYQLIDKPTLQHLDRFRPQLDAPRFIIQDDPSSPYQEDDLFHNPFGRWSLSRLIE
jgi:hypothetical protein